MPPIRPPQTWISPRESKLTPARRFTPRPRQTAHMTPLSSTPTYARIPYGRSNVWTRTLIATYFLCAKHISRGKGIRATRAAAYRAGARIRDERTSEVYDHSDRNDVACKEVVLASDLAGRDDMASTQNRARLWNAMEHARLRRNSRVAREWLVLLPQELTPDQRSRLVRTFATEPPFPPI